MSLYDVDFHAWAEEQARLARRRSGNELDWDNVAEELESLGKQQRAELRSRYIILLMHLLKWAYQPSGRGKSWTRTIRVQRIEIERQLRLNPSLKSADDEAFGSAYVVARLDAADETDLEEALFPVFPPFTAEEARNPEFWPDAATLG